MFENEIYEILTVEKIHDNEFIGKLKLIAEHDIFKGHFPDNPVLPGVVSIQIISDFLARAANKKYFLSEASNVKFMKIIQVQNPVEISIKIKITDNNADFCKISSEIFNGNEIFLKFSGIFIEQ